MRLAYLGMLLPFSACQESNLTGLKDPRYTDGIAIEVNPESLDFGSLAEGASASIQSFTITSIGFEPVTVSSIEIQGEDASSYSLLFPFEETILNTGEFLDVQLSFSPEGANLLRADAVVFSNDAESAERSVSLSGVGDAADLVMTPDPLDFGVVDVGCDLRQSIRLRNDGTRPLDVYSISSSSSSFVIENSPSLPFSLSAGEERLVDIRFTPEMDDQYLAEIEVLSSEPSGFEVARQSGQGQYAVFYEDRWDNPVSPASDIIFSLDQSSSMSYQHALLASHFSSFISELSSYTSDWQVMIVNADNGCNNGGIYTPTTPNYVSSFQANIQMGGGLDTERLLTIVSRAVEQTDPRECNSGFLRTDAMLHVIMVSDEPEQSTLSPSSYVNQIVAKKGDADKVRMSAIYDTNSFNNVGRYEAVASDTGGLILDIHSPDLFSVSNLQLLAQASTLSHQYDLEHPALDATVEVFVNAEEIPLQDGHWHYDSSVNAVIFDQQPPQEGDDVVIRYASPSTNCQ